MDTDRFGWVRMNACAMREAKTKQKEPQMGEQGCFTMGGRDDKKQEGDRHDHGDQRRSRGAIEDEQGVQSPL